VGGTRPCRVRVPLMKHLNRHSGGRDNSTSASHQSQGGGGRTGSRESVTDRSQSMIARTKYVQHNEAT